MLVHKVAGECTRIDIVYADNRSKRKRRLILETARGVPVLFSILNGEVIFTDVCNPAAGDRTAKTGFVGQQVGTWR